MKNLFKVFAFIFLMSFTQYDTTEKLQNGHYLVQLDEKYKAQGLNDFDFTLENEKFIMKIANQYEILEIKWLDEKTFLVKGYTEPANPTVFEKSMIEKSKIYFRITAINTKECYFTLDLENDAHPIYAGKFIKVK